MLIMMLPTWNDADWLPATLKQVDYWNPDQLYLCEGCWDKKFPARSTDGTREILEKWAKDRPNTWIMDNIRCGEYSENQMNQCRMVTQLSNAKPGDWIMYQAADFFLFKKHIDAYKKIMEEDDFIYPIFKMRCFWDSLNRYYIKECEMAINLPWRLVEGFHWIPRCHLGVNGMTYNEAGLKSKRLDLRAFHYEGIRSPERMKEKYGVGGRQSPETYGDGRRLKRQKEYYGSHPDFIIREYYV